MSQKEQHALIPIGFALVGIVVLANIVGNQNLNPGVRAAAGAAEGLLEHEVETAAFL